MRLSRSRKRSTLAHHNSSAFKLIGTKKRHNFRWVLPCERRARRLPEAILQRDRRCNAPELRWPPAGIDAAQGWVRAVRFREPVGREGFYTFGNREQNEGSGRYSVLEAKKDRSIASIDLGHPLFSSQNARAFGHPSAAAARPRRHRCPTRAAATDPDTPARRAAGDRQPAAASQNLGIRGRGHHRLLGNRPCLRSC